MKEQPIGTTEAGRIAGRHPRTIVSWIHHGDLPAMKMPGDKGPYLIMKKDLLETIKRRTTPKPYRPKEENEPGTQ